MKTSRVKFNLISIVLCVVFFALLLVGNVYHAAISVATVPGSYADTYADEKHLDKVEMTNQEEDVFDFRYETFDYNINDDGTLTLEAYKGVGTDVVVPMAYDEMVVTALGEKFFEGSSIKNLYIPPSVSAINGEAVKSVTIHCDDDTVYLVENPENDWTIQTLNDSDFVNFLLDSIPFRYNDLGDSIELVGYTGEASDVIIPSYINGKPVTKVSFDMLGQYSLVVFPSTVTEITGETTITTVTWVFACAVVFVILALLATLITMNVVLPKFRKLEEISITTPIVVVTFLYLIAQIVFSLLSIYKGIASPALILVVGLAMFIAFVIYVSMACKGRSTAVEVKQHIAEQTADMREIKNVVRGLSDNITNPELKKQVKRLEEDILTMPLKSKLTAEEVEEIITKLRDIKSNPGQVDEEVVKRVRGMLNL